MDNLQAIDEQKQVFDGIRTMMRQCGEDPEREGLLDTPSRYTRFFKDQLQGYDLKPEDVLSTQFDNPAASSEPVVLKNIPFYSLCEHHLLPFFGHVNIAYTPRGKVLGISKLARLVNIFAKRLQIQERLTREICDSLFDGVDCEGAAVWIDSQHFCMVMRGCKAHPASLTTLHRRGSYEDMKREDVMSMLQA